MLTASQGGVSSERADKCMSYDLHMPAELALHMLVSPLLLCHAFGVSRF